MRIIRIRFGVVKFSSRGASMTNTWRGLPDLLAALKVSVMLITVSLMTACGGGSGGGGDGDSRDDGSVSITGKVTDPEISGAAVHLEDADGQALTRIVQTGDDGRFSFTLDAAAVDEGLRVIAVGGRDTATGQDLGSLTLAAPYAGTGTDTVVSPLSTLALAYQDANGTIAGLAQLLGLSEPELLADPAGSLAAQRASLLTTDLLVALKGVEAPVQDLLEQLLMVSGDFAAAAARLAGDPEIPDEVEASLLRAAQRIQALDGLATPPADAEALVLAMNRIQVRQGLAAYLEQSLGFVPANETEEQRLSDLAEAILVALGGAGVPADSAALVNMARYLVVAHGLTAEVLSADTFEVPQPLDPDNLLPLLADSDVLETALPLAQEELLGDDNEARLNYFMRSDQSPYYQAARLFDGVIDDQVLDPIYASVAIGQAEAGLVESAMLTVASSIFQKTWKAQAYKGIGLAQASFGDLDGAQASWQKALSLYDAYLATTEDGSGVPVISADDGLFYQSLSRALRDAGFPEQADQALAPLNTYFDAMAGQPYTTAYGRLAVAAGSNAEDLVTEAVAQGLAGDAFDAALSSVTFFHDVVSGMGKRDSEDKCYALKTMQLASVGEDYLQLALPDRARAVLEEYEALFDVACNQAAVATYADNFAGIYGALGLTDEFKALVAGDVRAYDQAHDKHYEADALAALAVYEARDLANAGEVEAAIDTVVASTDDLAEQVELLTFTGEGSTQSGKRYLARLLWDDGQPEAALAVADAAFDIATSDAFAAAETTPGNYLGQGCRKVAILYHWLERTDLARTRMDACAALGESRMSQWSTEEQAKAWGQLAGGYYFIGAFETSQTYLDRWESLIDQLGDSGTRASQYADMALFRASNASYDLALASMAASVQASLSAATVTDNQETLDDAIHDVLGGSGNTGRVDEYQSLIEFLRTAIGPEAPETAAAAASEAKALLRRVLVGEDGASGLLPLIAALNDPEDQETYRQDLVYWLTYAGYGSEAEVLAREAELATSRNARLARVAEAWVAADDYPSTTVARFDYDGDGRPDFYSPDSTEQQRTEFGLALDTDIDGDGIPDATDATPYCASCDL